jgi:hypothetical protein
MNEKALLDAVVWTIVIVKVLFVTSTLADILLTHVVGADTTWLKQLDAKMKDVRAWSETLFTVGMSALLIYHFRPKWWSAGGKHASVLVSKEETFLFYMFGWILVIESISDSLVDFLRKEKVKIQKKKRDYLAASSTSSSDAF